MKKLKFMRLLMLALMISLMSAAAADKATAADPPGYVKLFEFDATGKDGKAVHFDVYGNAPYVMYLTQFGEVVFEVDAMQNVLIATSVPVQWWRETGIKDKDGNPQVELVWLNGRLMKGTDVRVATNLLDCPAFITVPKPMPNPVPKLP